MRLGRYLAGVWIFVGVALLLALLVGQAVMANTEIAIDNALPSKPEGICPAPGDVNRDGWTLNYETSNNDGLRITDVTYQGRAVLTGASVPEWHADYNGVYTHPGFIDVPGCGSGGGGFPIQPFGETEVRDLLDNSTVVGFEVVQDFRMSQWGDECNYRYEQHYQFYADGRFRVVAGSYGKGCGTDPTWQQPVYRPVIRIDIAVNGDNNDSFAFWDGQQWAFQQTELYRTPYASNFGPHHLNSANQGWLVVDGSGQGYTIEPGLGQFNDGGMVDDPFIYVTRHNSAEGDNDLPSWSIAYCCYDDHKQGPENFVDGESIGSANLVLWYVSQSVTDRLPVAEDGDGRFCWTVSGEPDPEAYPCFSGPMFTPFELSEKFYLPLVERP